MICVLKNALGKVEFPLEFPRMSRVPRDPSGQHWSFSQSNILISKPRILIEELGSHWSTLKAGRNSAVLTAYNRAMTGFQTYRDNALIHPPHNDRPAATQATQVMSREQLDSSQLETISHSSREG